MAFEKSAEFPAGWDLGGVGAGRERDAPRAGKERHTGLSSLSRAELTTSNSRNPMSKEDMKSSALASASATARRVASPISHASGAAAPRAAAGGAAGAAADSL